MPVRKKKCDSGEPIGVVSLFSGCGGMDLGFEGGFEVLERAVNRKTHADWVAEKTRPGWVMLPRTRFKALFANDILPIARAAWIPFFRRRGNAADDFKLESVVDLVKKAQGGDDVFPQADVVTGGFPCQDFSLAGKRRGFNSHKAHHGGLLTEEDAPNEENRGKLYMWMRNVVDIVRPKVFIAENVKGLVSLADVKAIIENDFRSVGGDGYLVVPAKVLYAPDYGVPQTRERVIFFGFRKNVLRAEASLALSSAGELPPEFNPYPSQTHCVSTELGFTARPGCLPHVTAEEALAGLPEPTEAADPAQRHFSKAKWYGKHCQGNTEFDLSRPAPTIRSEHHGNIEFRRLAKEHGGMHVDELARGLEERRLTVRECARLQTFPDNFEFVRGPTELGEEFRLSGTDGYKVVGNAVPPLLAFHIAWRLQELWPKLFSETSS